METAVPCATPKPVSLKGPQKDAVYRALVALRDGGELESAIRRAWSQAPGTAAALLGAKVLQTHYKPFARARLLVEAQAGPACPSGKPEAQILFVQIYPSADEAAGRLAGVGRKRPLRCIGPPAVLLDDWNAVVWSLPNGPRLRWVRACLGRKRFRKFQRKLGLDLGPYKSHGRRPQIIRYVPRKRALFRHQPPAGRALYIKFYGAGGDVIPVGNLAQLSELSERQSLGFMPPRLVAHSASIRAAVMEEVPGIPMTTLFGCPEPSVFAAVGRAIARLHGSELEPSLVWSPQAERRALDAAMADIVRALPALAPEVRDLLQRIDRQMSGIAFDQRTPVHGNLFGDQILIEGNEVAIVDWDDMALGDPMYDLGRLIAHIVFVSSAHPEARTALIAATETLLDGYRRESGMALDRDRLRWQVAVALLMRAKISALRILSPRWIADIQDALSEASVVLDGRSLWLRETDI